MEEVEQQKKYIKKKKKTRLSGLKDCTNLHASIAQSALGLRY